MSNFVSNKKAIYDYMTTQFKDISNEELLNSGFQIWYHKFDELRKQIINRYVRINILNKTFKPRVVELKSGNIIDHHILSYISPLEFKRIGWCGKRLAPHEHMKQISDYFTSRGKRFIYIALPNKGCIYPSIIYEGMDIDFKKELSMCNSPQWRKYVKDVVASGVEVLDMYPIFMKYKQYNDLFSKQHYISPYGAKITGETIANYLKMTTDGITEYFNIDKDEYLAYSSNKSHSENQKELLDIFYFYDDNRKVCYWNQGITNSKICIFGDCNLQAYNSVGGGITNNIVYKLKYPIYNAGRRLVFGYEEKKLKIDEITELLNYDIIIYVAFSSAPFVRSAVLQTMKPRIEYHWQKLNLS